MDWFYHLILTRDLMVMGVNSRFVFHRPGMLTAVRFLMLDVDETKRVSSFIGNLV